jgi:hypothetical protein
MQRSPKGKAKKDPGSLRLGRDDIKRKDETEKERGRGALCLALIVA